MNLENGTPGRGAVLLAELKAVVDSLPPGQREDVIKILEILNRELNADDQSRHSVDPRPE